MVFRVWNTLMTITWYINPIHLIQQRNDFFWGIKEWNWNNTNAWLFKELNMSFWNVWDLVSLFNEHVFFLFIFLIRHAGVQDILFHISLDWFSKYAIYRSLMTIHSNHMVWFFRCIRRLFILIFALIWVQFKPISISVMFNFILIFIYLILMLLFFMLWWFLLTDIILMIY